MSRHLTSKLLKFRSGNQAGDSCRPDGFKVVMVRHGQSEWNKKNLFCGWVDSELSERGHREASDAGKALKKEGYKFEVAYTSALKRAHQTLQGIMCELGDEETVVHKTWRLNERHYGGLTGNFYVYIIKQTYSTVNVAGLDKIKTVEKYGAEQVQIWRRSFDVPPPPMEPNHPHYQEIKDNPMHKDIPEKDFPMFESLKMTIDRTLVYWYDNIVCQIRKDKPVLIVAHGNSLRGLVKTLDKISDTDIMGLNLPTGIPFEYLLDKETLEPVAKMRFMGDPETVKRAIEEVAQQTKKK